MLGNIFNIQRFSIQDGPGIRTTVFLKGCPLRCAWCHNPESYRSGKDIFFDERKCVSCKACAAVCENHVFESGTHAFSRMNCVACGRCAEVCIPEALEICGKEMSAEEVLKTVLRDAPFYADTGGMTLSGGEPMLQKDFSLSLLRLAKEKGIHTAMETSGYADKSAFHEIAPFVDLFLFDIKLFDEEEHRLYTGVSNKRILENLKFLNSLGKKIILRCPIIPDVNMNASHFENIARLLNSLESASEAQIEPYHPLGLSKLERMGKEASYKNPSLLDKNELLPYLKAASLLTDKPITVQ